MYQHNNRQSNTFSMPRVPLQQAPPRQPRPNHNMQQMPAGQNPQSYQGYVGQPMAPMTTMFLPPSAVPGRGNHQIIIGQQQMQVQQSQPNVYAQYTVAANQPAQYSITPNAYYPQSAMTNMQASNAVYYPHAAPGQPQITPTRPPLNPMPNPAFGVTQSQQPLQKRERKALAIVDPSTMQEVHFGAAPAVQHGDSGSGPNSGASSAIHTPIHSTPPPSQQQTAQQAPAVNSVPVMPPPAPTGAPVKITTPQGHLISPNWSVLPQQSQQPAGHPQQAPPPQESVITPAHELQANVARLIQSSTVTEVSVSVQKSSTVTAPTTTPVVNSVPTTQTSTLSSQASASARVTAPGSYVPPAQQQREAAPQTTVLQAPTPVVTREAPSAAKPNPAVSTANDDNQTVSDAVPKTAAPPSVESKPVEMPTAVSKSAKEAVPVVQILQSNRNKDVASVAETPDAARSVSTESSIPSSSTSGSQLRQSSPVSEKNSSGIDVVAKTSDSASSAATAADVVRSEPQQPSNVISGQSLPPPARIAPALASSEQSRVQSVEAVPTVLKQTSNSITTTTASVIKETDAVHAASTNTGRPSTESILRRPPMDSLQKQLANIPAELLAKAPTSATAVAPKAEAVTSEKTTEKHDETKAPEIAEELTAPAKSDDVTPEVATERAPEIKVAETGRSASPFDDRKKKPLRQRAKDEEKRDSEKEKISLSTQPIDFTPGYVKNAPPPPVRPTISVSPAPAVNDVDTPDASTATTTTKTATVGDDVAHKNEQNDVTSAAPSADVGGKPSPVIEKKPALQYEYKEDQWSPLNPEGKKSYDRKFLLKLQFTQDSTTKPDGLPHLPDVILENIQSTPGPRPPPTIGDFTPGYVRQTSSQRGTPSKRGSLSGPRRSGPEQPMRVIPGRQQNVNLHRTDNAYKASAVTDQDDLVVRKFRALLNKLTPQKFQTLIQQICDLEITTPLRLKRCIDTIFEKAIDEPSFSVAYANACSILAKRVVVQSEDGERVTFKKLLLNRCQEEFQKENSDSDDVDAMQKEIDEATSEDVKKLKTEEMQLRIAKNKRRSLGNIRFIGELFKLSMLTEKIMHECILQLLKSIDEESLECMCRLLTTVGKLIDTDKGKPRIDQYFERIAKIISGKQTSSRVRFMLRDVVELRENHWVPRRDENNPKTIAQIHKEAHEEKVEKAVLAHRLVQESHHQQQQQGGGRRGRDRMDRGQGRNVDGDGWQSVGAKANTLDPNKMKLSKPQNIDDNIQLGPGGSRFGGWGRGAGVGRNVSQEADRPQTSTNRFMALDRQDAPYDQKRAGSGSRGSMGPPPPGITPRRSDSRDKRLAPGGGGGRPPMTGRPSKEREREAAMYAVRQISGGSTSASGRTTPTGSRNQSRESSRNRGGASVSAGGGSKPGTPPVAQELPKDVLERKTKAIIDEYLSIQDLKEAKECVKEIPVRNLAMFVDLALNHVLERNTKARQQTGVLLHDLVNNTVLTTQQYLDGLTSVIEFAEDMEIDIPKIWAYFGELIGPMVQDGSIPLSFLKTVCDKLENRRKAAQLVAEILHDASHRLGHIKVGELWLSSSLQWTDFMAKDQDLNAFLVDNKLEYTQGPALPPSPGGKNLSPEQVQRDVTRLIVDQRVDNETFFDWVTASVGDENVKKHYFIRALTTAVCRSIIVDGKSGPEVDEESFKARYCMLLQRYLDHNGDLELQALYALQQLIEDIQHPPGVLRSLFDVLYDEDIISEDAFHQWSSSDDPKETRGKGVALASVVQFFTWLREAEEEDQ